MADPISLAQKKAEPVDLVLLKLRQLYHDAKIGRIRAFAFVVIVEDGYQNGTTCTDVLTDTQRFYLDAGIESLAFRNRMIRHQMEEDIPDGPESDPSIEEKADQANDVDGQEGNLDDLDDPPRLEAIAAGIEPAASRVLTPSAPPAEPRDQNES